MKGKVQALSISAAFMCAWSMSSSAIAEPKAPQADYFGHMTAPVAVPNPVQNPVSNAEVVRWFEAFDDAIATHQPSAGDRVILQRPLDKEAERVKQYEETASKVARNYRHLVSTLKAMDIPAGLPEVKQFRDLTIDWYSDAASVYEDLIRPRRPAKTIEELQASLNEIIDRSKGLAQENSNLNQMDLSLRKKLKVHLARTKDSLQQYVRSKPQ